MVESRQAYDIVPQQQDNHSYRYHRRDLRATTQPVETRSLRSILNGRFLPKCVSRAEQFERTVPQRSSCCVSNCPCFDSYERKIRVETGERFVIGQGKIGTSCKRGRSQVHIFTCCDSFHQFQTTVCCYNTCSWGEIISMP